MAKVFIEESTLTKIGNAIRGKTGKTALIDPAVMDVEISSISSGGGSDDLPEEAFLITGNCEYRFREDWWSWFIEGYGNRITTSNISNAKEMFYRSKQLTEIPFQVNVNTTNASYLNSMFANCENLVVCPKVRGVINWANTSTTIDSIVGYCYKLRDLEDLFTSEMVEGFSNTKCTSSSYFPRVFKLNNVYSLRHIPSWWYKFRLNPESTTFPEGPSLYGSGVYYCVSLDEARNIPVWVCQAPATRNIFSYFCSNGYRLKAVTFETNSDGTPIVANWRNQTIDLSSVIGYSYSGSSDINNIINRNSGITADKRVTDDASYQALKNDPDWFTSDTLYSRYNHDSAVETINSLPDTSAYLAEAGGTNTIKFRRTNGTNTDGGAIGNLTEEEIAVATAKGWTVTLV